MYLNFRRVSNLLLKVNDSFMGPKGVYVACFRTLSRVRTHTGRRESDQIPITQALMLHTQQQGT